MSDFFDPESNQFGIRLFIVILIVLFLIGLCINNYKTHQKHKREKERNVVLNPFNEVL